MAVADLPNLKDVRFTPTQQKIMDLLSDGISHSKYELRECLWDTLTDTNTVHVHICALRKILRPLGYIITIQFLNGKTKTPLYILSKCLEPVAE